MTTQIHTVDGLDLVRVHVPPSSFPVEATVKVARGSEMVKKTAFYVRIGNGTREITSADEKQRYVSSRWGSNDMGAA